MSAMKNLIDSFFDEEPTKPANCPKVYVLLRDGRRIEMRSAVCVDDAMARAKACGYDAVYAGEEHQ